MLEYPMLKPIYATYTINKEGATIIVSGLKESVASVALMQRSVIKVLKFKFIYCPTHKKSNCCGQSEETTPLGVYI